MRSVMVVVGSPLGKFDPDLIQGGEPGLVQLLVSEASVEAFDVAVLHGLAGSNVMPFDSCLISP